jgi:hypothetical protein
MAGEPNMPRRAAASFEAARRVQVVRPLELGKQVHHLDHELPTAYGPRLEWMSSRADPRANVYISSRDVSGLVEGSEPNVELHEHAVSQTYLLIGAPEALEVEIEIEGERGSVTSPAAVFVPAGARHRLRIIRGTGTLLSVVRDGAYA